MSDFGKWLENHNQTIDLGGGDEPIERWMSVLRDIGSYIVSQVNRNDGTLVSYELIPGYQVILGQQVRLRLLMPERNWSDTLFAVFIALDGSYLMFDTDLTGRRECRTDDEAFAVAMEFLNSPQVRAGLVTLRDSAYKREKV